MSGDGPVSCSVCQHPRCSEIDAALVRGARVREVAQRFGVPVKRITTHAVSHSKLTAAVAGRPALKLRW